MRAFLLTFLGMGLILAVYSVFAGNGDKPSSVAKPETKAQAERKKEAGFAAR